MDNKERQYIADAMVLEDKKREIKKDTPTFGEALGRVARNAADTLPDKNHFKSTIAGFAAGAELRGIQERKKGAEKHLQVIQQLQSLNDELGSKIRQETRFKEGRNRLMPKVSAYLAAAKDLAPTDSIYFASQLLEGYGQLMGKELKLLSVDNVNPARVTYLENGKVQMTDLAAEFAEQDAVAADFAAALPQNVIAVRERQRELERQNQQKDQTVLTNKQIADLNEKQFAQRQAEWQHNLNKDVQHEAYIKSAGKKLGQEDAALLHETKRNLDGNAVVSNILTEMKSIAQKYPKLFNSEFYSLWTPSSWDKGGVMSDATYHKLRHMGTDAEVDAALVLHKLVNNLVAERIKSVKNASVFIENIIEKASPNMKMTAKAFEEAVNGTQKIINQENTLFQDRIESLNNKLRVSQTGKQDTQAISPVVEKNTQEEPAQMTAVPTATSTSSVQLKSIPSSIKSRLEGLFHSD